MYRWLMRALLAAVTVLAASLVVPPAASASPECGTYWPSSGHVATNVDGNFHSITLSFKLNPSERDALQCMAEFLELDFVTYNTTIPADSQDYGVYSNLPDAQQDIGFHDETFTPAVTMVQTRKLQADVEYHATVKFHSGISGSALETSVQFVPSHWSHQFNIVENGACKVGKIKWDGAWCLFPETRHMFRELLKVTPSTRYEIGPGLLDFANRA